MRFEQDLSINRPPEDVFDYVVDPSKLMSWQIHKTSVEPLTGGPPRLGSRFRERTKPPGMKEFEQVVEFTSSGLTATARRPVPSEWHNARSNGAP